LCERRKPSPLLDYECSLNKSYKASQKAKRARKDVAQLEQQSLQSIDPLVIEDDYTNAQGGSIDLEQLNNFMDIIGLTQEQLMEGATQ
jgi:hypothetical protein